tara:strand:- start:451 stop:897 length:447 start_codon:yes stop_codon:yes gene_type:complete
MNRQQKIKEAEILLSDLGFSNCSDSDEKNYKLKINTYEPDFINVIFGGDYNKLETNEFLFEVLTENNGWIEEVYTGIYFNTIEEVLEIIFSNFDCFEQFETKYNIKLEYDDCEECNGNGYYIIYTYGGRYTQEILCEECNGTGIEQEL